MPQYFFNLENHEHIPDEDGIELAGAEEARIQAVIFAGEYLRHNPSLIWDGRKFCVIVEDEMGDEILRIAIHAEAKEG